MQNEQPPRRFVTPAEMQVEHYPWCRCEWLCRPGLVAAERMLLVRAVMPRGKGHRFHRHPHSEEVIYILEGQAEQWVGQEKRILGPGDAAHIPTDVVHATHNLGDGELRFLAILSPTHPDGPGLIDMFDQDPWRHLEPTGRDPAVID